MVKHIILWKLKEMTEEEKAERRKLVKAGLEGLAGRIPGTQQKPQRSAARAQIQNPGLSGKPGKMGQHHGICAQRKSTGRNIQLIALWQCFHEASPLMVFHRFYIWYASSEAAGRRRVL